MPTSNKNMESASQNTTPCSNCKTVGAQYVVAAHPNTTSQLTTTTVQVRCEVCYAQTAIKLLGNFGMIPTDSDEQPTTSMIPHPDKP
jgi:hypothetical protein